MPSSLHQRFERVAADPARELTLLRTRYSFDALQQGDASKLRTGDFVCRIWAEYGPPESTPRGVVWTLRDRQSGASFAAYARDGLIAYGSDGGPAEQRAAARGSRERAAVDAFDKLLDARRPVDCEVSFAVGDATIRSGMRHGAPFDEITSEGKGEAARD